MAACTSVLAPEAPTPPLDLPTATEATPLALPPVRTGTPTPQGIPSDPIPTAAPLVPRPTWTLLPTQRSLSLNPDGSKPVFCSDIHFSTVADPSRAQYVFPQGTRTIYAMWAYAHMRDGLTIRVEWNYFDVSTYEEEVKRTRMEIWSVAKYGASGMILDEALSDANGLGPGMYDVSLSIDGLTSWDPECDWVVEFEVVDTDPVGPVTSPDGARTALVERPGTIIVRESNGVSQPILVTDEISGLAWMPDGLHLVYSERDRSEQIMGAGSIGRRDSLWILDVATGGRIQVATADENLHDPRVSPDGRYVAAVTGSGWGDACLMDLGLAILELDPEYKRLDLHTDRDFTGLLESTEDAFVFPVAQPDLPVPGIWLNDTQLDVGLDWTCVPGNPAGVYRLDLSRLQATKVADLTGG